MSEAFPFEQTATAPPAPSIPVRRRHPLNMPAGSVRALLTLMVLGTVWALLLMPPEKELRVPPYLYYLTFLVIGSYFGTRSNASREPGERHPLFLPRGSIRLIIMAGFIGVVAWGLHSNPDFLKRLQMENLAEQPYLPLIIFGAFFLGAVVSMLAHAVLAGPYGLPAWYQDVQAWISLLAMLGLGAEVIYQLVIYPDLSPESRPDLPHWQGILSGVVAFYFGARS